MELRHPLLGLLPLLLLSLFQHPQFRRDLDVVESRL
jgi:hypothetical protein